MKKRSRAYHHDALLIEIVLLGNFTLETELRAAAETGEGAKERLIAVFLAYIEFADRHPDLFAVMFQSGMDKSPYPEVHLSARKAFGVAGELAAQVEPSSAAAQELALAIWTMAHGFATLAAEGALARVGSGEAHTMAEALARRLLSTKSSEM